MPPPQNIAIVICHGSYHSPAPYGPFITALQAQGFEAHCPQRPTCDLTKLNVGDINNPDLDRDPPPGGYPTDTDDVDTTTQLLLRLINDEGKNVLLLGHSSGGWVATQAAVPELQAKPRRAEGKPGGIIGLFYFGGFAVPVGESVHAFFQPKDGSVVLPPWVRFSKHGLTGLATLAKAPQYLFNDLSPEEAKKWESTLTASGIMTAPLTNDAYSVLPCAYVVLENDAILPKEFQELMVGIQRERGVEFTVFRAPAGHSPQLSWTEGLVESVKEFVGGILEQTETVGSLGV
ncbi:alpha/beta hydrolase [Aspergillus mulundensis]|uniref:AB hydrolase-1 domain-containing protein n=1 Tax=Aspergillus mulundensis TaxID=1810919 RepID=A0A3D8RED9_9EURO|nr:Uncharacterized protein DSM5745_07574 [Aspergillus mulundensis]RDW72402.1 Uncharacterized protein DSM5745_07574 [Aspergillus mulundensis]